MKTSAAKISAGIVLAGSCLLAFQAAATGVWVSPDGNDQNPGTATQPLASLPKAQQKVLAARQHSKPGSDESFQIILRGGFYPFTAPLQLRPEDSGTLSHPLVITAAPGEKPVLSGGVPVTGWHQPEATIPSLPEMANGHIWEASVPVFGGKRLEFRQLWVNGTKAVRAREPNGDDLDRLTAWDKTNQIATIPAAALAGIIQPDELEMVIDQVWEIAVLRVKSIQIQGANAFIRFKTPESRLEFQHPWPPVMVTAKYHAPFFLANAIQFLDSPGEWFEDLAAGKVYYWPRAGEKMTQAQVFAPALETLVQITGAPGRPTANIEFQGVTFAHTTWLRPSQQGHVPLQAGMFLLDARKLSPRGTSYHPGLDNLAWIGRPSAAVSVQNAGHISFERCTFTHLASAGLDFATGTHDDSVTGCFFRDLGGNGIQLGKFSDTNVETHVPYNPSDESEICAHEKIANNVVTDCGNEDWGCVGIGVGYARDVRIEHNEVFNLPYTGISVGWGWTRLTNALRDNYIHANHVHYIGQRLGDLGGIYTLSAQPGTVVSENCIQDIRMSRYVPDPEHWFYLYLDEGSSFITVSNNWCPAEKFLKNTNGPGNLWLNNGPQVSESIKNAAGLEARFQDLTAAPTN